MRAEFWFPEEAEPKTARTVYLTKDKYYHLLSGGAFMNKSYALSVRCVRELDD
jgi:hypothetical protein